MIGISKKDVLHIVQQFFNYLTSKTIVSFEWSTEKKEIENLCRTLRKVKVLVGCIPKFLLWRI